MAALIILVVAIMAYAFVAAVSCTKSQSIVGRSCDSGPELHWVRRGYKSTWCPHSCISFWLMGLLWPIGIPAAIGSQIGKSNSVDRTTRRREKEIDEAEHKVRLAQIRAQETEALEKALGQT